ncbi:uncharacterized protein LOC111639296 isoform X1 [Centruroides sculpturatus]|uniref:uncharacterized protein LOC111639296 isoform X1 n=1 Tax=Centruroides sculpturatus TaxID=218467 RepID=UPI000C6D87E5|nr:uncharacterized protein LOC111639296 isoform X1 [Centruroides sculpturatus]
MFGTSSWFAWHDFRVAYMVTAVLFFTRSDGLGCHFPPKWAGMWFQKGVQPPIRIEGDVFTFKGKCIDSENDMFLIEDSRERCYRCVGIYEKHHNVLQYRETYCDEYRTLKQACSRLNVDAHLYSMFRVNASAVPCPLHGPFIFTYSRGHGECKHPISTIDTCTDDTHILFRFQACADVKGTESSVEELTCLASWKEGSYHYLVGKMKQRLPYGLYSDHNNYRCFVFDHLIDRAGYQVSQSADATCDGLVSPREGSRIMRLTRSKHPTAGCQFPSWVTLPHHWHTLDGKKSYIFNHKNTTFLIRQADQPDTKVTCTEESSISNNYTSVVAYSMSGCNNGYVCITFHRRSKHVIEIQIGGFSRRPQDACAPTLPDMSTEFVTLITRSPTARKCPRIVETNGLRVQAGRTSIVKADLCRETTAVVVGCRAHDTLEFLTMCASFKDVQTFHCHGNWEENGRSYLITGLKNSRAKYCFVYSTNDKVTHLSGLHDTCHRTVSPGVTGNLTFNISAAGDCDYLLKGGAQVRWLSLDVMFLALLLYFVR